SNKTPGFRLKACRNDDRSIKSNVPIFWRHYTISNYSGLQGAGRFGLFSSGAAATAEMWFRKTHPPIARCRSGPWFSALARLKKDQSGRPSVNTRIVFLHT
ncbi:hypothetical protein KAR34_11640, partial [bacterium]|nr:hypothetical protein [bacterium]